MGGGLATAFSGRAKKISTSKWVWFGFLVLLSSAAPFVAVYVFNNVDAASFVGSNLFAINVFRLATLSPLIFFISYASIQYSRERDLQERYEFKSSMAQSLPAYTKIMKDEFYVDGKPIKNHEEDLVAFAFNSVASIYKEPFVSKVRNPLVQVNRSGKVVNTQDQVISSDLLGDINEAATTPPPKK